MKKSVFVGFAASHKGHVGLSAAKLLHVVVCFRDFFEGPGNWKWDDQVMIAVNNVNDNTVIEEQIMEPDAK